MYPKSCAKLAMSIGCHEEENGSISLGADVLDAETLNMGPVGSLEPVLCCAPFEIGVGDLPKSSRIGTALDDSSLDVANGEPFGSPGLENRHSSSDSDSVAKKGLVGVNFPEVLAEVAADGSSGRRWPDESLPEMFSPSPDEGAFACPGEAIERKSSKGEVTGGGLCSLGSVRTLGEEPRLAVLRKGAFEGMACESFFCSLLFARGYGDSSSLSDVTVSCSVREETDLEMISFIR